MFDHVQQLLFFGFQFLLLILNFNVKDEEGVATTPGLPEALVQQWENEGVFKKFRDDLVEAFGAMDQPLETPSRKRGAGGPGGNTDGSTRKRGRVLGPEDLCKQEDLKGDELHKVGYSNSLF